MADKTVVTELIVDARGATAGSAEYIRATQAAQAAVDKLYMREEAIKRSREQSAPAMVAAAGSIQRTAAAWDRLRSSIDPVAAAEIRARRSIEQATIAADNAVKRGLTTEVQAAETLQRLRAQQVVDINKVREAQQQLAQQQVDTVAIAGRAANDNNLNSANVAAQFQDIFVTAQMGMNPLQIALQQGSQLTAVLGPMGAAGAVRSLGAAFMSLINPVSLITLGLVAAAAAAIQFIGGLLAEAPKGEEALKAHLDWLKQISVGYENAQKAAEAAVQEAQKLPQAAVESNVAAQRAKDEAELAARLKEIVGLGAQLEELTSPLFGDYYDAPPMEAWGSDLAATRDLLRDITADGALSADELDRLEIVLTQLKNTTADEAIKGIAEQGLAITQNYRTANAELAGTVAHLTTLQSMTLPEWMSGTSRGLGVGSGIDALTALTPDNRTAREKGADAFNAAVGEARTTSEIDALTAAYAKLNTELDKQDAIKKSTAASRRESPGDKWQEQLDATTAQIEALEMQNATFGRTTFEATRAATAFDLVTAAQKAGLEITDPVLSSINTVAERMAEAKVQAEGLQTTLAQQEPFDALKQQLASLDEQLAHGAISWETYEKAKQKATAGTAAAVLGSISDITSTLAGAFEDNKALAAANIVVSTAAGAMKAYEQGGLLGFAGAAAIIAAGAVQLNSVLNAKPGSSSISGSSSSAPAGNAPATAAPQSPSQGFIFNLYGRAGSTISFDDIQEQLKMNGKEIVVRHIESAA